MKKTGKILLVVAAILVATTLVSATLLISFGQVQTTLNVRQSVTIDDHNWDSPISETLNATGGNCYFSERHVLKNDGDHGIWLTFQHTGVPDLDGITISVYYRTHHERDDPITIDTIDDNVTTTDFFHPPEHYRLLNQPFYLPEHSVLDIKFHYCFDMLIVPGIYSVTTTLVPAQTPPN